MFMVNTGKPGKRAFCDTCKHHNCHHICVKTKSCCDGKCLKLQKTIRCYSLLSKCNFYEKDLFFQNNLLWEVFENE